VRFVYCDCSLIGARGHFASTCRRLAGAARDRGLAVEIYGNHRLEAPLIEALGARPLFGPTAVEQTSDDKLCGYLENYNDKATAFAAALRTIEPPGPDDIVFVNSVQSGELAGVAAWLARSFENGARPRVAVELGMISGMALSHVGDPPQRKLSPATQQPALYRWAVKRLVRNVRDRLHFVAFDHDVAWCFAQILQADVAVLPLPLEADPSPRRRAGACPTIAFLGEQREDKGRELIAPLIDALLASGRPLRVILQDADVRRALPISDAARRDARVELVHRPVYDADWRDLLDRADLIVLPYEPPRYALTYSLLLAEAAACAIPMVAPARTTLATWMSGLGGPGVLFEAWTVESVLGATFAALDRFEALADLALKAAGNWPMRHGPERTIEAILAL
jgi:hypothetical protein